MKKVLVLLNLLVLAIVVTLDIIMIISPTWTLKSVASAGFVLGGIINAAYAIKTGAGKKFTVFMLIGFVFAMAGDIVNYLPGDLYFITGTALFAVAHVFYIIAYYFLCRFRIADIIIAACIFVPSVLFITLAPIFDFGGVLMETVCIVYALILSLMAGKALSNARTRTAVSITIAVGSVLFFISDLSLLLNMFTSMHKIPRILCLATYYPAQVILAFAVFVYAVKGIKKDKLKQLYIELKGDEIMPEMRIEEIVEKQRAYFKSGKTLDVKHRLNSLKALHQAIKDNLDLIHEGLKKDLGKSERESYMCETGLALSELSYMIKHVKKFAKAKRVLTPLAQFKSKSYRLPSPYGNVLIMNPWNYPVLLSLDPLIDAVAAGNTAVLKLSAYSPNTNEAIKKVIESVFAPEYVAVVFGGREANEILINTKFDYVFFTGSKTVGKLVYEKAAQNLTPVTLELGGKSPCIVDETANIPLAAKRIVWGKFLNLGQTCVAPDYIFCAEKIHDKLIAEIKKQIIKQFSENPIENPAYGKIITEKHFIRVNGLIDKNKVVHGGKSDETTLKIEPTVLDNVTFDDAVMQEEIFGPVLPVITYSDESEVMKYVSENDSPLALYIFSSNKKRIKKFTSELGFGGGCVNDVVIHLATPYMPFGGFGASGLGSYHGRTGFETFTHYKSIVDKATFMDLPMRYQPFKKLYDKLVKIFLH